MKLDVTKVIDAMKRLPREAQIEIARTLLKLVQPQKDKALKVQDALKIAIQSTFHVLTPVKVITRQSLRAEPPGHSAS